MTNQSRKNSLLYRRSFILDIQHEGFCQNTSHTESTRKRRHVSLWGQERTEVRRASDSTIRDGRKLCKDEHVKK